MIVIFRVDTSAQIGRGHITRCVTLAIALKEKGAEIVFICRKNPEFPYKLFKDKDFNLSLLPAYTNKLIDKESWLGVEELVDAEQTVEKIGTIKPDWLIVDHYGIGYEWESLLKEHVKKLFVIDDYVSRKHNCDLFLNQNHLDDISNELNENILSENTTKLLGPQYVLLDKIYCEHKFSKSINNSKRILLYLGTDPDNITGQILTRLLQPEFSDLKIDIVLGGCNPFENEIRKQAESNPLIYIHDVLPDLCQLMKQADLSIGAGGATTWERMFMGVPSLIICTADNQLLTCEALYKEGLIEYAGHVNDIDIEDVVKCLKRMIDNVAHLRSLSNKGQKMVDGLGVERITDMLLSA
jgi:UDP-2,4-diacetamido-2,4,6-trideoxy-beta-L-altropyranose hydrolase